MALLDYIEAQKLLLKYSIKSAPAKYVSTPGDAISFANGRRIALKGISNKALHKSKAGLVRLDLVSDTEISKAFSEIKAIASKFAPYKILAQQMSTGGVEIIIGGRIDPQFGKLILIGLGGIYVEAFKDFSLRTCPITRFDAEEMLAELRSGDVITYKGKNRSGMINLLMKTSKMLNDNDWIQELDLNPVIVKPESYDVVDIRVLGD
ncbi:MAG: acetate--CoA ligase family protein [Candidatus Micrarchaeota archaeon]|nr:acetate--CoA ligase family protein [Candidatus Micrarchaeota archaeon]